VTSTSSEAEIDTAKPEEASTRLTMRRYEQPLAYLLRTSQQNLVQMYAMAQNGRFAYLSLLIGFLLSGITQGVVIPTNLAG
jgi:hypothetical protein